MGIYVNPAYLSKEEWLWQNGKPVIPCDAVITETHLPVCIVHNGMFNAAAIAFDEDELGRFKRPDERPRVWFMVERSKLLDPNVSDLYKLHPKA